MSTSRATRSARASRASKNDIEQRVRQAVEAAEGRQAADLKVLGLGEISDFTDYFVVCSGASERQVQAIADAVEEALRKRGVKPALVEGYERGEWVLVDYFDFIFHVFTPATREFYALERLWGDAERRELSA